MYKRAAEMFHCFSSTTGGLAECSAAALSKRRCAEVVAWEEEACTDATTGWAVAVQALTLEAWMLCTINGAGEHAAGEWLSPHIDK